MSSVTRKNAFRYAGVVEATYLIEDMTVEIIADGIHLPKPLLQFVYKFKGVDKTALCTDAMRGAGMPDGESILGSLNNGQKVIIEDGVAKMPDRKAFAGSVATTDRLVRTMIYLAGVPLIDAVRMMSLTPARILHIDKEKGSLEIGKDADIVIFDNQININNTILKGHVIYTKWNEDQSFSAGTINSSNFPVHSRDGQCSRKRSRRPNLSLIGKQTGNKYDFRRCPLTK